MMNPSTANDLSALCRRLRVHVLRMLNRAKSSHIGSNYSIVELLAVLYNEVLRIDPREPSWEGRDRFVLSKGHAAAVYYAVLAERGFFPVDQLDSFYQNGSNLAGHATTGVPGIEVSTGSLGHGLPLATGMALAAQRDGRTHRVFALLSDGECDEGTTWEAALFAGHHRLSHLNAILDYNKIQSLGPTREILDLEPLARKWEDFGWCVREADGHNLEALKNTLGAVPFDPERPSCVIAHTVKGKGVSFMENTVLWHYRVPQGDEYEAALRELEESAHA
jgi:transketolase